METDVAQKIKTRLENGDVTLWEKGYFTFLRQSVLAGHAETFPMFDYDYAKRVVLYAWVNAKVLKDQAIDFLEFGVFKGDSFRRWLSLNTHPQSRFFGFDTFEGLPEEWTAGNTAKGGFHAGGQIPQVDDPRACFVQGLFQATVPDFAARFQPNGRLVLHLDADLYSSTLFVLMTMNPHMPAGTVLVFDEFIPEDEFAAFHHYCKACMRQWRILAARRDLHKIALELTA